MFDYRKVSGISSPSNLVIFHEEIGFLHAHVVEVYTAVWHLGTPAQKKTKSMAKKGLGAAFSEHNIHEDGPSLVS